MSIETNEIIFEIDAKLNFNEILKRIDIIKKNYPNAKIHIKVV